MNILMRKKCAMAKPLRLTSRPISQRLDRCAVISHPLAAGTSKLLSAIPWILLCCMLNVSESAATTQKPDIGENLRNKTKISIKRARGASFTVAARDDVLSLSAFAAPIELILMEIGRQHGIKISLAPGFHSHLLSDSFTDLPLARGLARILRRNSFSLVFGENGEIQEVHVMVSSYRQYSPNITSSFSLKDERKQIMSLLEEYSQSIPKDLEQNSTAELPTQNLQQQREALETLIERLEQAGLENSTVVGHLKNQLGGNSHD